MERSQARRDPGRSLVGFRVGDGCYAVEVPAVLVILAADGSAVPFPHGAPAVRSVREYRGRSVPLVDVRRWLALPPAAPPPTAGRDRQRWILLDARGTWLGLVVDEVTAVFTVTAADAREVAGAGAGAGTCAVADAVRAVYAHGRNLVLEIDLGALARSVAGDASPRGALP